MLQAQPKEVRKHYSTNENQRLCDVCKSPLRDSNPDSRCRHHSTEEIPWLLTERIPAAPERVLLIIGDHYGKTQEAILRGGKSNNLKIRNVIICMLRVAGCSNSEVGMKIGKLPTYVEETYQRCAREFKSIRRDIIALRAKL